MDSRLKIAERVVVACLFMSAAAASHAAPVELSAAARTKIDAIAQATVKEHKSAGLAIGIMSDGEMIFAKGYGSANLEDNIPVTPDTVFRIGSLTKQFAAAAVLRLVEQGKLGLDDELSKFYPDFPRGQEVTIRQLLSHTSGIHNYTGGPDYERISHEDYSTQAFVNLIAKQDPLYDFAPATAWSYSNSGYFLLGAIIEKVSGSTLADFLDAQIFANAGLANTAVDRNEEIVAHRARGYERPAPDRRELYNASYTSMTVAGAAGNLRSTIGDLARWSYALLNGKVITAESVRAMTAPSRLANGDLASTGIFMPPPPPSAGSSPPAAPPFPGNFGFGLLVDEKEGRQRVWHGGGINGFSSRLETFPREHLTIVVLANTAGGADEPAESIVAAVLQQLPTGETKEKATSTR